MLLMNKTLLKLAKGLWGWILAIAGVSFLTLVGTTALAEIVAGFLGSLFAPEEMLGTAWSAVRAALIAAVFTFLAQLLKGLLEYRTAAAARTSMRRMIFKKVLELDAGGIEKIGPVSAITASVDAVEQMQAYFSSYLPSLIYSVLAPIYLFFHLKDISLPVAALLLVVSLCLLPLNNVFRGKIEELRKGYWRSLDDMTGYYMDGLRGLTTLKLFDRDREHSRILGEKADILNQNINKFMKINFTSFLVTEGLIYAAIVAALVNSAIRIANGSVTIAQALTVLMLSYSYFSSMQKLMSASHGALTAISAAGKVEEILEMDTSRAYEPSLPEDPEHFEGIRMEQVSYGYEGREQALTDISDYAWIVFTSPTGVRVFFEELRRQHFDVRRFSGVKFAVIGTGTAKELEKHGFYADLMPEVFDAAHLGAALAKVCSHARVLIPRAAIGSPELLAELQKTEGVQADDIAIYDTVYGLEEDPEASPVQIKRELEQGAETYVLFTSASTVKGFAAAAGDIAYTDVQAICIGAQTKAAADAYGMQTYMAERATIDSLIEKLEEVHREKRMNNRKEEASWR